jgi:hypothetical protein
MESRLPSVLELLVSSEFRSWVERMPRVLGRPRGEITADLEVGVSVFAEPGMRLALMRGVEREGWREEEG